jgi:TPR repeat protein
MTAVDIARPPPIETAAQPWPGLDAFSEALQKFFFGRTAETEELYRRIRGETVTLLIGQSGLGKTSLLRAGLAPRLPAAALLPVFVRLDYAEGAPSPLAQVKAEFVRAVAAAQAEATPIDGEQTLWGYFHRADRMVTSRAGEPLVPVLIFDQFEEVFTLGLAREASRATAQRFLAELAELIENRPPDSVEKAIESDSMAIEKYQFDRQEYRIVIALREDYLPQLDSVRERAPLIERNRFRLRRMTGRQGFDAVTKPVPGLIAPELAWEILDIVGRPNPEDAFGAATAEGGDGREVEPALLSLFCRELNEKRLALGLDRVTPGLLAGNRESIIESFYENALADQDPAVRKFVEDELLSYNGVRESVSLDRANQVLGAAEVPPDALNTLVNRRLLRFEERFGVARVEIIHDALAAIIRTSRDIRRGREEESEASRRKAEAERQTREIEAAARRQVEFVRERRRKQWAYVVAGVMASMIVAIAYLASVAWRQSKIAEAVAEGNEYINGQGRVPKDYKKAMHWFRMAADQDNGAAEFNVGVMYENGWGIKRDYAEARRWYEKATAQGYAGAFAAIGYMYIEGEGEHNDAKGFEWYLKAAKLGHIWAQFTVGDCYEDGKGVARDYAQALRWYEKAAAQDYAPAQNAIGHLYDTRNGYDTGNAVNRDDAEALGWYHKAADRGNARSRYHIGMFYADGRVVSRDVGQAHAWMEEAKAEAETDASKWLAENPLRANDGAAFLAATEKHVDAARVYDEDLRSDDSKQGVALTLFGLSWALTLNNRWEDARARAEEALTLYPSWGYMEMKHAHALLLLGHFDEAKKIYFEHKDDTSRLGKNFADAVRDDFLQMRVFGIDTPDMKLIEELLAKWIRLRGSPSSCTANNPNCAADLTNP